MHGELSEQYPNLEFVARTGEMVRGHVVSWGEHEDHGPLSLKREIRELDRENGCSRPRKPPRFKTKSRDWTSWFAKARRSRAGFHSKCRKPKRRC